MSPLPSLNELCQSAIIRAGDLAHAAPAKACQQGLLTASWQDGRLIQASFKAGGDSLANAFLELYCQEIEGLPCEEAAAYAASYVVHRLTDGRAVTGYQGILNPAKVHPALAAAEAALRALRPAWRQAPGMAAVERADFLAMPDAWLATAPEVRLAALHQALTGAIANGQLPDCGLAVEGLEDDIRGRPVRVTLTYPKSADAASLPGRMRQIEQLFRSQVAPWLEIYAEERQDHNKLRRTILIEQRPPTTPT